MAETMIFPAPVLSLSTAPVSKFAREKAAFRHLLPLILNDYRDKYVAIHDGQVVGSGDNLLDVADEAYSKFGYQPIYVDLVTDKPQSIVRIRSPRVLPDR